MADHVQNAVEWIRRGIEFKECHRCGCWLDTVAGIKESLPLFKEPDRVRLGAAIARAVESFKPREYDCLGCKLCYPAVATAEISKVYPDSLLPGGENEESPGGRGGWPPFPGDFRVLGRRGPVAICTLNSKDLIERLLKNHPRGVSIVGSLATENLGIERLIKNVISNPHIRFLIVCGEDSMQKVGHLPGQSIKSLFEKGVDENGRIIGACGGRPFLKNTGRAMIERFREQVELVDMIGCTTESEILSAACSSADKRPHPFSCGAAKIETPVIEAGPPGPLQTDPEGYFVIYPDSRRGHIVLEHYKNDGTLNTVIHGKDITYIYTTVIQRGLISRLDHACYLGKELERAAASLRTGAPYIQDMAPDGPEEDGDMDIKGRPCKVTDCC